MWVKQSRRWILALLRSSIDLLEVNICRERTHAPECGRNRDLTLRHVLSAQAFAGCRVNFVRMMEQLRESMETLCSNSPPRSIFILALFYSSASTKAMSRGRSKCCLLRGEEAAKRIQLSIEYSPEPPFQCGSPRTAPPELVNSVRLKFQKITESRLVTAKRIASRLGLTVPSSETG